MADRKSGLSDLFDAVFRRLKAKPEDVAQTSKDVDEEIHIRLPEELSARKAIEEDRRRKKAIDDMLRDSR